jgi:dihydroorotate dehydrogenase
MLSITLFGVTFNSTILNASRCHCENQSQLNDLLHSDSGAIVSKQEQLSQKMGMSNHVYIWTIWVVLMQWAYRI